MTDDKAKEQLSKLTSKKHIFFTDRGNTSILLSLKLAKQLGRKKVFMQDQGGWITYGQFSRKLKLELVILDTDSGLVKDEHLGHLDNGSILLINSMPGYHALQENMAEISNICRKEGCFLINDASGSIGTESAKHGDIILGSFGEWKPIEVKYGGFLAYDEDWTGFFRENLKKEVRDFYGELNEKLAELPKKLKSLYDTSEKIKAQLRDFDVIHRRNKGFNVIVRFGSDDEMMRILDYCKLYGYEHTLCPRYIRVLERAISIEAKR